VALICGNLASKAQQPRQKGNVSLLVAAERARQTRKDALGDLLSLLDVGHDTLRIACVQKRERIAIPSLRTFHRARQQRLTPSSRIDSTRHWRTSPESSRPILP
jgi:hypothetical protein